MTDPENTYVVVNFPAGGYELHSTDSWDLFEEAATREELDLKMVVMGLETDWSRCHAGTQYRVRRIPE